MEGTECKDQKVESSPLFLVYSRYSKTYPASKTKVSLGVSLIKYKIQDSEGVLENTQEPQHKEESVFPLNKLCWAQPGPCSVTVLSLPSSSAGQPPSFPYCNMY